MPAEATIQQLREEILDYQLLELRSRGDTSEVWEGVNAEGQKLAIKFLPCDDDAAASREFQAIQMMSRLKHSNITRIHQVSHTVGCIVVAMDLADGSMLDLLEAYQTEFNTPIVSEHLSLLLWPVARAIDYLNFRQHQINGETVGIQMCLIKPSNLLVYGETVKLGDFGLATITDSPIAYHRRLPLDYVAPEVFQGRLHDRSDQYALAVSWCHLRGARLPFQDSPKEFSPDYVRPAPDLTMLPEEERPIIARALSVEPEKRWPTCANLIEAIEKLWS